MSQMLQPILSFSILFLILLYFTQSRYQGPIFIYFLSKQFRGQNFFYEGKISFMRGLNQSFSEIWGFNCALVKVLGPNWDFQDCLVKRVKLTAIMETLIYLESLCAIYPFYQVFNLFFFYFITLQLLFPFSIVKFAPHLSPSLPFF